MLSLNAMKERAENGGADAVDLEHARDDVLALIAEVERLTQERNDAESRYADAASELREERRRHQEAAVQRDDLAERLAIFEMSARGK